MTAASRTEALSPLLWARGDHYQLDHGGGAGSGCFPCSPMETLADHCSRPRASPKSKLDLRWITQVRLRDVCPDAESVVKAAPLASKALDISMHERYPSRPHDLLRTRRCGGKRCVSRHNLWRMSVAVLANSTLSLGWDSQVSFMGGTNPRNIVGRNKDGCRAVGNTISMI